jgi:3-oxoacyl-[acyl-carrier-protein] synthase III
MPLRISHLNYVLGTSLLPIHEFVGQLDMSRITPHFPDRESYEKFIKEILGQTSIAIEVNRSEEEMLAHVIGQMFNKTSIAAHDIAWLVIAGEHRLSQGKNIGQKLQQRFRLSRASILNVSGNHCANIESFLSFLNATNKSDVRPILVLGCNKCASLEQRVLGTYGVLGDAAGAMLLNAGRYGPDILLECSTIVSNGALHDASFVDENVALHCKYYINVLREVVGLSGLSGAKIGYVVTHNANRLLFSQCVQAVGIKKGKIYEGQSHKFGHFDSLDFIVNLTDLTQMVPTGRKEFALTFGIGFAGTYVACVVSISTCSSSH